MDPADIIAIALDHLGVASEMFFEAADLMSDRQAEYHGDRGMGVPAKNQAIERLYSMSKHLDAIVEDFDNKYLKG